MTSIFRRQHAEPSSEGDGNISELKPAPAMSEEPQPHQHHQPGQKERYDPKIPRYNHNGHLITRGIHPDGESGRKGIHPVHFFRIIARSSSYASLVVNVFWPFTIAAIILYFGFPEQKLWIFITAYIGMVPPANLIGFAGQELARKLPKVIGVILETTLGSLVEIILFMVLIKGGDNNVPVIRAAILGSILANLLLCLGICFFVGGMIRDEQTFHEAVSEVGSNLMLVAGMGLVIPTIYYNSLSLRLDKATLDEQSTTISRATAIILLVAFFIYIYFQMRSHHSIYDDLLEQDEQRDQDHHLDLTKAKLTFIECIIALAMAITFVALMAVFLVKEIPYMVEERHVSDAFMGLILVPVVEKAAEHLTAIDEAWDNSMNFALSHVLGASIQTALLNTPLVVLVGWGLGTNMSMNFELFDAVVLILAILAVGNFLRDGKSNYLEGALCFLIYVLIAVSAFYYPNPPKPGETSSAATGAVAARMMMG